MLTVSVSSSKAGSLIIKDAEASRAPREVLVAKEVEGMCGLGVEVRTCGARPDVKLPLLVIEVVVVVAAWT
jgi:hypothetical protein